MGLSRVIVSVLYCLTSVSTLSFNIQSKKHFQLWYSTSYGPGSSFVPINWFQFADDAAVISGQEEKNQILVSRFYIWRQWTFIRVAFGIKKYSTNSIQFQPKLIIEGNLIPAVKNGDSFRYLGRHFDFNMSNNIHKSELSEITSAILTDIDLLPLHPKNKIALYIRNLLSKLSSHFTVSNLPKTWVCKHLDNVVAQYICKWLELLVSAALTNIILLQHKYG